MFERLFFFLFCFKSKLDNGKKARISQLENKHEIKEYTPPHRPTMNIEKEYRFLLN